MSGWFQLARVNVWSKVSEEPLWNIQLRRMAGDASVELWFNLEMRGSKQLLDTNQVYSVGEPELSSCLPCTGIGLPLSLAFQGAEGCGHWPCWGWWGLQTACAWLCGGQKGVAGWSRWLPASKQCGPLQGLHPLGLVPKTSHWLGIPPVEPQQNQ